MCIIKKLFLNGATKISLKQQVLLIIPVVSVIAWIVVVVYNSSLVRADIADIAEKDTKKWMEKYVQMIVDDMRVGDILRVRNSSYWFIEQSIFSSVYVMDNDRNILVKYPMDTRIMSGLAEISDSKAGTLLSGGHYSYPILDRYGTRWGYAFMKPMINKEVAIVREGVRKIVAFALGLLLLELAVFVLLIQRIFSPLDRMAKEIRVISNGCERGCFETSALRALANDCQGTDIGELGGCLLQLTGSIEKYRDQVSAMAVSSAIGTMVSHISHDIRSPLSVLRSYVIASSKEVLDDECSAAAMRSVDKLQNMAEDLLDYSRAQQVKSVRVVIDDIVKNVLREVSAEAEQHRVAVACRDEAGIVAMVDREKMGRVLTNIVLNAVQAHERPGSVSVQVSASDRDLAIAVVDDGKGIHPENMSRIFESSFTFGKPRGTGLGLAYCKRVIEAHGGELSVESEPGKGSTFTIRIPGCVMTAAEAQGEEADVCANRLEIGPEAGACNVMVVDDDADVLRQWRRIIDEKGGRLVYSAASVEEVLGAEALDFAAVDAAIVDYQYEGSPRNGIELIRLLKGKGVRQVHLCTGFHGDESIRREAMDAGADSVIPKPIATF